MAGIAHAGIGLAAKRIAPTIPVWILIGCTFVIDLLFMVFWALGLEKLSDVGAEPTHYYSHGLFMAVVWSLLAALLARLLTRDNRLTLVIGLLVFSHWVLDFISHPMTAIMPEATGLPVLFKGSPTVGLGLWNTTVNVFIGEAGIFIIGLGIYLITRRDLQRQKQAVQDTLPADQSAPSP